MTNSPSISVIYKDGREVKYHYDYSSCVGSVRKADALAVMRGDAVAFYPHRTDLKFTSAKYYPDAKKWYLKSDRCRPTAA